LLQSIQTNFEIIRYSDDFVILFEDTGVIIPYSNGRTREGARERDAPALRCLTATATQPAFPAAAAAESRPLVTAAEETPNLLHQQ
jgi:hypothetical protein